MIMNYSFRRLLVLLNKLKVIGLKEHKISHATLMVRSTMQQALVKPHWIPLPVTDLSSCFIEVVPRSQGDFNE